jgi:SAM-dependent methyltransferase
MSSTPPPARNWFDQGGQDYARFRPDYPQELAAWLAGQAPDRHVAVDVGCGNGQLTRLLAAHFGSVVGLDPSADQIANATPCDNVVYQRAPAENLPLPDGSTSLITAAQAAHWFDLPAFYAQARRIAAPGAVLALISYGIPRLDGALDDRFRRFYDDEIGPYWPPERKLVDAGYATLDFPFEQFHAPPLDMRVEWNLAEFLGYIFTWSAVRGAREAGQEALVARFADDMAVAWGDPDIKRRIAFPISMRTGRL